MFTMLDKETIMDFFPFFYNFDNLDWIGFASL